MISSVSAVGCLIRMRGVLEGIPEERKTEVRSGVVKDRKKRFFEVTLVGSGHVTCPVLRGSGDRVIWCHKGS